MLFGLVSLAGNPVETVQSIIPQLVDGANRSRRHFFQMGPGWTGTLEVPMFYDVKILDRKGKVKKILSGKSLSRRYWKSFFDKQKTAMRGKPGKRQIKTNKGDQEYDETYFSED